MGSPLRKVTILGASGRLGPHILKAFQNDPAFEVTVVTRKTSPATFPPATKVVKVEDDYPEDEMVQVFRGQDAVVLSLGYPAEHRHPTLVDASVKAGVKRLIASAWGGSDTAETTKIFPIAAKKVSIIEDLKSKETEGWSWTAIHCGLFFDFCIRNEFFGFNRRNRTAQIWDDGNTKFSASNLATIGVAVTKVLHSPEETANRKVYISSFECSMNDILDAYKKATGASEWSISHVNSDEQIKAALGELRSSGSMMAMGKIALASVVKEGMGADFAARRLLDNELLGLPQEDATKTVATVLKEKETE